MTTAEPRARTCPSSTCVPGNLLIGIVRPDGTVAPVSPPLEVDGAFVARAGAADRPPEARMRFAGPCVTSACRHWRGRGCGLADLVGDLGAAEFEGPAAPPPCHIRATCQWWAQRGVAACRICPMVVHSSQPPRVGGDCG